MEAFSRKWNPKPRKWKVAFRKMEVEVAKMEALFEQWKLKL